MDTSRVESSGGVLGLDECDQSELGLTLGADDLKAKRFAEPFCPRDVPRLAGGLVQLGGPWRWRGGRRNNLAARSRRRHQRGQSSNEGERFQLDRCCAIRPRLLEIEPHGTVVEELEAVVGERRAQDVLARG
jgi:hypothetical protein